MDTINVTDQSRFFMGAGTASVVTWKGKKAVKLNGLLLVKGTALEEGSLTVRVGAEAAAYAGLAFHVLDVLNYELAYAQPHTSGAWDAIQYDPVFKGSNTWQLYYGVGVQQTAVVPTRQWFDLRVDFQGSRAAVWVNDQPPLLVNRLAHTHSQGMVGLWSYRPAYFCDLCISSSPVILPQDTGSQQPVAAPPGCIREWHLVDYGRVACEPDGILNLNRYLPAKVGEARLERQLEVRQETEVEIEFGFSDVLVLLVDDQPVYRGFNTYRSSPDRADRGYVAPIAQVKQILAPGPHRLAAVLNVTEPFGWGLLVTLRGDDFVLSPLS
jgi:hypothetical protein